MKTTYLFRRLLLLAAAIWSYAYGQNANINYSSPNSLCTLSSNPSCCNTFHMSSNTIVDSFEHKPLAGGVTYNGTSIVMQVMKDTTQNPPDRGNGYAIVYPFKTGFDYKVAITMAYKRGLGANAMPTMNLGYFSTLPSPSVTQSTACGPVIPSAYLAAMGSVFYTFAANSSASTTYTSPLFSVSSPQSYLAIVAYTGFTQSNMTIAITKVVITEIPRIAFTMTPPAVTKVCGTALSQTFTINNVYSTPGVTGYTWNLGATPNRWYYGGSPAPATLSTAGNSITLDANACDLPPSSISGAGVIGATSYLTNTVAVNAANPSLTITGNDAICNNTPSVYTVNNIPCGGTVSWNLAQTIPGTATMTTSGNQATITKTGNGNIELTATITASCSASPFALPPKPIIVGTPQPSNFPVSGPPTLCTNQAAAYSAPFYGGITYNWSASGAITGGGPGASCMVNATPFPGMGILQLNTSNVCGSMASPVTYFVNVMNCFAKFEVSPNPVKEILIISTKPNEMNDLKKGLIYGIRITDLSGVVKKQMNNKSGIDFTKVPVADLLPGTYIVSVFDGTQWESHKVVVQ